MAETIGDRVKAIRQMHDLTQVEFGQKLGYKQTYISFMENDKGHPDDRFLKRMKKVFGCDYLWLIDGLSTDGTKSEIIKKINDRLSELSLAELETITSVIDAYTNSVMGKRQEKSKS